MNLQTIILVTAALFLSACGGRNTGSNPERSTSGIPALRNHVPNLDGMLTESSGLIYHRGRLWTINDSGGDAVLFALDPQNGKVLQAIMIENGKNRDWESLAQDKNHIYICDVGNNFGRREVLTIYKIPKDSIPASGNVTIPAERINFTYAGRRENNAVRRSAYDCEAVFAFGDSLYIFTKDWETRSTTLYTCSNQSGDYELHIRKTYPVNGLITGADMSPDSSFIIFCGYRDYVPVVWVLRGFDPADYSHDTICRFEYPAFMDLQTEGIAFLSPERVIISCEMTEFPAALYTLNPFPCVK